ncbi:MAG: aminotransferase class I/II-fold pyridoxal phosphate-dependent enzyme [Candidatus Hydrogenedens sp.]|nr:aminotransferase class I/II-fold pyridoxal phosphate-dependent enzyme [Candidatus Hydrogenedens sp.]
MNHETFLDDLSRIQQQGRWRTLRETQRAGGLLTENGAPRVNFSSNDYLDLAGHAEVCEAAREAADEFGAGAGASRLMSGNFALHEALEQALAELLGQETALVFPSGFQGNVAVLSSITGQGDLILSDALNHASLIDGMRLSKAEVQVYSHADELHLSKKLAAAAGRYTRVFVVTESLFSMDGDIAPLLEINSLCRSHGAFLVVDEAHALGVFGEGGGLCRDLNVQPDVTLGTMSKALGAAGGFAATSRIVRDLLINRARAFIFSTALNPPAAASALASIRLVRQHPSWGRRLLSRAQAFRDALTAGGHDLVEGGSQIIPIMIGENAAAMDYAQRLRERGLMVTGIRPPTVPEGTARLRLSVTLAHDEATLEHAAKLIGECIHALPDPA